ncbi:IS1096 element passenger TnpR family protein [Ruminococcus bromii]|uniref:IS1096 element passenger TnpR family protein n=1 Tax=Ruminococcus bromii TaxID=40518 RepID=UPI00345B5361
MNNGGTFKIVYIGCENKICRDIQISSNLTMAVLGYAVLSSFSTCAYHLFMMTYKGTDYELDDEEFQTKPARAISPTLIEEKISHGITTTIKSTLTMPYSKAK